ncbi:DUF2461 domain-containing protein [Brevibacillus sp. SYP-B805]|uniref:DUF2461 domain-containing protein n=1 Tax=Brevibacillus sp. SYP-B805 TaxID=1578199 RepID=UPI0013EBA01B|nr:DUF2461 domain-containing protein [Brevibacillus sp. SYP-B805]NGQ96167.1 DUF2461 domain-containing protein [Brevibacillus sp. SYP-B805]
MPISSFTGYSPKTIAFLQDLQTNNNKAWFEDNKHLYTDFVLKPTQSLVSALSNIMLDIDPYLETSPSVGKTISRIYRDTRFSMDKSPFRTNIWITFKRPKKEWVDAPAFFFELTPNSYRYGMGFYSATKDTMDKFRELIDRKPDEFERAVSFYPKQQTFVIEGDLYKKPLDPSKPKEILDWYQRKNLYLVCNRGIDSRLFGDELLRDLTEGFSQLSNLYHYLYKIKIQ